MHDKPRRKESDRRHIQEHLDVLWDEHDEKARAVDHPLSAAPSKERGAQHLIVVHLCPVRCAASTVANRASASSTIVFQSCWWGAGGQGLLRQAHRQVLCWEHLGPHPFSSIAIFNVATYAQHGHSSQSVPLQNSTATGRETWVPQMVPNAAVKSVISPKMTFGRRWAQRGISACHSSSLTCSFLAHVHLRGVLTPCVSLSMVRDVICVVSHRRLSPAMNPLVPEKKLGVPLLPQNGPSVLLFGALASCLGIFWCSLVQEPVH